MTEDISATFNMILMVLYNLIVILDPFVEFVVMSSKMSIYYTYGISVGVKTYTNSTFVTLQNKVFSSLTKMCP